MIRWLKSLFAREAEYTPDMLIDAAVTVARYHLYPRLPGMSEEEFVERIRDLAFACVSPRAYRLATMMLDAHPPGEEPCSPAGS